LGVAKLRTEVRMKLVSKWDRARYGEHVKVENLAVVVDDGVLLAGMVNLLKLAGGVREKVIDAEFMEVENERIAT